MYSNADHMTTHAHISRVPTSLSTSPKFKYPFLIAPVIHRRKNDFSPPTQLVPCRKGSNATSSSFLFALTAALVGAHTCTFAHCVLGEKTRLNQKPSA